MSESRLGIPAHFIFAYPPDRGRDLQPTRVEHFQFGIIWDVTAILDRWEHPGRVEQWLGRTMLAKWWLLKVSGPLPGRPAESGEFIMEASFYGDPPGWWVTAEQ